MKIAILGTGSVGRTLGSRWAQLGHSVVLGSRDPSSERVRDVLGRVGHGARAMAYPDAAAEGEVLVLATLWKAIPLLLESLGQTSVTGKVLIDCVNALHPDLSGLDIPHGTSAGELIASWAPTARVVKAFNTVSAATMANPIFHGEPATLFYCGDNTEAKATVRQLAAEIGFAPVDAGPLYIARYLEPLAMLYIHLAFHQGWGSQCAFRMMKR